MTAIPGLGEIADRWASERARWLLHRQRREVRPADGIVTAFRDGQVTLRERRRTEGFTNAVQEIGYQGIRVGDLVVHGMDGFAGAIGVSDSDGKSSPVVHAYRPNEKTDARYIAYALRTMAVNGYVSTLAKGIRERSTAFDASTLADVLLPVPPPDEQRRIADFLDAETARIDRLVAASQRQSGLMIERLTESLRALTTTARRRGTQPTGIAWMPKMASGWHLMKIGRSFTTSSGTTPRSSYAAYFDGPHFWVNTGDLRDGFIQQPKKTVTDAALTDYPTLKIYTPGSLVVAMYGATTGRTGILTIPACVNQACCVLSELGPVSSQYAFFWFRAHREEILKLASGGGQPNISQDLVRALRIPAPSRHEQDEIVAQARSLEDMTMRQQQLQLSRAELLKERRQALITAAVTGQFDVSTASGRNVTDGASA